MTDTTKKVMIGCGIGCGVILMLFVLLCGTGFFLVKDTVKSFEETGTTMRAIEERYGRIEDYCPPADGRIPADRIETFLSVRENTADSRSLMEEGVEELSRDFKDVRETGSPFWKILGLVRKGFGALPGLAEYYTRRNEALLDAGMGPGEYTYLYITAYYAFLGYHPGDGPDFPLFGYHDTGDFDWDDADPEKNERLRTERADQIILRVRRLSLGWLDCQLKSFKASGQTGTGWQRTLVREMDALELDRRRLVWADGLPGVIRQSLEPFRDRLAASYSPLLNPFEIQTEKD
ncbi:MAG TPA: hypothetical protein ENN17_11755 [bacterium]|nr:hypothetical protein [bacterium]